MLGLLVGLLIAVVVITSAAFESRIGKFEWQVDELEDGLADSHSRIFDAFQTVYSGLDVALDRIAELEAQPTIQIDQHFRLKTTADQAADDLFDAVANRRACVR
jgi:hypothetical protein